MEMDLTQPLPEDVLAEVLRRLPPHSLAAARCVRKTWRAIIDAHRLLNLLPLSLAGIFINFVDHELTEFFFRPSTGATISGKFYYYMPTKYCAIKDHCNGLLLLKSDINYVLNPATRRWAALPPCPRLLMAFKQFDVKEYIVFDPTMSLHYKVFKIPCVPDPFRIKLDHTIKVLEWPPSAFILQVFSSKTGKWEDISFVRQGDAIGTIADMQMIDTRRQHHAVYWRGELYVHCHFIMRMSLSNSTYQVIEPPKDIDMSRDPDLCLGRSEGVYFALLDDECRLRVWILK